jgi:hypothetical protein
MTATNPRVYVVRYTVPVYAYVDVDGGTVTKVVISNEEIRLDYDRLNHEHFPEVVMDPEVMDIPGPFEERWKTGEPTDSDEAWDDAEKIVGIAESVEWPAWENDF